MARELCEDKSGNMVVSPGGFCYSDVSSSSNNNSNPTTTQAHLVNQIQRFESNRLEIFNFTTGMDTIGFSKNLEQQRQPNEGSSSATMWKGFFSKPKANSNNNNNHPGGPSSSKTIDESTSDFYHQELNKPDFGPGISETSGENVMVGAHEASAWQENGLIVDDSNLRCVFSCDGNERPSGGLSLSLCSSNPSPIGMQSFELGHTSSDNPQNQQEQMRFMDSSSRDGGFFGKSPASIPRQQQILHHQGQFQVRSCKYLGAAQELLNEFVSLGTKQMDAPKQKPHKPKQWEDESGSSSRKQSLYSLEFMELQKRKRKLLSMLEEVERRYKRYCDQMKAVVSSFEAVGGARAATVYSALASKAMSRHFRCLKDGIAAQILATKKAMGENDPVSPGTRRGETPRLRIIDQTLRQQRAFQQMCMMESHPWRPQRGLPERSVSVLRAWLFEHFLHPYPSDVDKHILARQTGLSRSQVSNWFINARVRLWKPMVEEMYMEETKDPDIINRASSDGVTDFDDSIVWPNQNPSSADQKPTPDQLVQIDSECLSSIISNPDKNDSHNRVSNQAFQSHLLHHDQPGFGSFGTVELDFSSYNHHAPGGVSFANHDQSGSSNQNFNGDGGGGGGGVSLTLGLQQHGGSGVSLAFSPASQSSLFFARDHIEDCQPAQYSLLDGEGQNLPYRNLMGAQLLHNMAG